jgi:hypothetical protein
MWEHISADMLRVAVLEDEVLATARDANDRLLDGPESAGW